MWFGAVRDIGVPEPTNIEAAIVGMLDVVVHLRITLNTRQLEWKYKRRLIERAELCGETSQIGRAKWLWLWKEDNQVLEKCRLHLSEDGLAQRFCQIDTVDLCAYGAGDGPHVDIAEVIHSCSSTRVR